MDYIKETLLRQTALWSGLFQVDREETEELRSAALFTAERQAGQVLFREEGSLRERTMAAAQRRERQRATRAEEAVATVWTKGETTEEWDGDGISLTGTALGQALTQRSAALGREAAGATGRTAGEAKFQQTQVASRAGAVEIEERWGGQGGGTADGDAVRRFSLTLEEDARRYDGGFPLY